MSLGCPRSEIESYTPTPRRASTSRPNKSQGAPPAPRWLNGTEVQIFGAGTVMGHLLGAGDVHGVGRDHRGWVTFNDGELWLTGRAPTGEPSTQRVRAGESFSGRAEVLAVAQVAEWQATTLAAPTALSALPAIVERTGETAGCRPPLLFRLEGPLRALVFARPPDQASAAKSEPTAAASEPTSASIIGVVADRLEGMTPVDGAPKLYAHLTRAAPALSGALLSGEVSTGATLRVPACRPAGYLLRRR